MQLLVGARAAPGLHTGKNAPCFFVFQRASRWAAAAVLQMRDTVRQVAHLFPTAIISGRGRDKVEAFVQLPELFYAGSHGMDIAGPRVSLTGARAGAQHKMDLHAWVNTVPTQLCGQQLCGQQLLQPAVLHSQCPAQLAPGLADRMHLGPPVIGMLQQASLLSAAPVGTNLLCVLQGEYSIGTPHNFQAAAEFRPLIDQLYHDLCLR